MDLCKSVFILFIVFLESCNADEFKAALDATLVELRQRAKEMYGEVVENPVKLWEFELEDRLAYPRGDKSKLAEISERWSRYYSCGAEALPRLTAAGALPAASAPLYAGATARLPCGLCVAPRETVSWYRAESLLNLTFVPLEQKENMVVSADTLTIYHARDTDAGVYRCNVGNTEGGLVLLEVMDYEENYRVVRSRDRPAPVTRLGPLTVRSAWGEWSTCARCGRWGRRRRYGMCQVSIAHTEYLDPENKTKTSKRLSELCMEGRKFLEAFPKGVWCRSKYLPACIRNLPAVQARQNEIMLRMCKVPCKENVMFSLMTRSGVVLERANNSAGIYSLIQTPPPQPPPPVRDIVFAVSGVPGLIRCPGTCLSDAPMVWRAGNAPIIEAAVARRSAGRVRVNARDHLVFTAVYHSDANLYSCWQERNLCGEVKLEVWRGETSNNRRIFLVFAILGALYTLRVLSRTYRVRRRRV